MPTQPQTLNERQATSRRVRLFRNGANQAIRIPREFELPGTDAMLAQIGNTLVLTPIATQPPKGSAAALAALLSQWGEAGKIADEFPDVDSTLLPATPVDLQPFVR